VEFIVVGRRRYRSLYEIHVEKPSKRTIFSEVKIQTTGTPSVVCIILFGSTQHEYRVLGVL
jgi:hypothetical protein